MSSKRKAPKKWISEAVHKTGALRSRLQDAGLAKSGKRLSIASLKKAATGELGPQTAKRAKLALTMRGFKKRKKGVK